jgi:hypothetical protein
MSKHTWKILAAFALAGCMSGSPDGSGQMGGGGGGGGGMTGGGGGGGTTTNTAPAEDPHLTARQIDYGQALRTAAIKLVGGLPTPDEIAGVTDANSYAAQIDKYLADPRFPGRIRSYFQDMMKMGGQLTTQKGATVDLDAAPTFAAELVVNDRSMMDLFTAAAKTCPTLDVGKGTFTDADCQLSNNLTASGVLTDPGAMAQFYSNMSMRRVRWIQESFVCTKYPAEYSTSPVTMGNGQYVSPWPFKSITGGTDKTIAPVNFQDTSSVVCANCHTTMNHMAPLFSYFDEAGQFQTTIQVHTPVPMNPMTKLSDWLPAGETFAWRFQKGVKDITAFGAAMAADPDVADCQVARAWNWAMSKTDIVNDLTVVPATVIQSMTTLFTTNGYKLKPVLRAIFTGDDFVKF